MLNRSSRNDSKLAPTVLKSHLCDQRAADFVRANPGRKALMLAVEICSACYYLDKTLETVIGNAICADGAAAFLLVGTAPAQPKPMMEALCRFLLKPM